VQSVDDLDEIESDEIEPGSDLGDLPPEERTGDEEE
jgi:hypothetical protein